LLAKSFILLHVQIANTYDEMSQQSDTSFKCQTTPSSLELLTVTPPLQHISRCGSLLTRSKQLCLTIVGCNNTAKHHSPTRLHKRRTKLPLGEITIWWSLWCFYIFPLELLSVDEQSLVWRGIARPFFPLLCLLWGASTAVIGDLSAWVQRYKQACKFPLQAHPILSYPQFDLVCGWSATTNRGWWKAWSTSVCDRVFV